MSAQDKIDSTTASREGSSRSAALAIQQAVPQLQRRLPAFLGDVAERYAAIAVGTIQDSPGLRECTPASIVRGVIRAAEYGLALDGVMGHAYLVPYKVRGVMTAQFQLGYRGLVELMYRTGMWASVMADVICEGDVYDYRQGTDPFLSHKPALVNRGKRIAAYAVAHPSGGGVATFVLLNEEQVLSHRSASKAFAYKAAESIWEKFPDVAWRKSAIRELSKSVAMATDKHAEVRRAAIMDERVDAGDETVMVDAEVSEPNGDRAPEPGEGE